MSDLSYLRKPRVHMIKTYFLFEIRILAASLSKLEKFQRRSSVLPNMKYNCAVLFLRQIH